MRVKTKYVDNRWFERGPIDAGIRLARDTWRVGVRDLTVGAGLATRRHWWSIEVRLEKVPRKESSPKG